MRLFILSLVFFLSVNAFPQSTERIVFYNTENLFDTYNEINKIDEAFLPSSMRHWTPKRYKQKLSNLSSLIMALSDDAFPSVIGMSEVENITVLNDIVNHSALKKIAYSFIHKNSADPRGIDVALLYDKKKFTPLKTDFIPVCLSKKYKRFSRDILYVKGVFNCRDTFHFFINHWSSRLGGRVKSEYKRIIQAKILASKVDSIKIRNEKAKIIIMGDFNDTPNNVSIRKYLCSRSNLNNLAFNLYKDGMGTYKYKAYWDLFDQMIVSKSVKSSKMYICKFSFLFEEDKKYGGLKPKRTYNGIRYLGGFSDHLPVYIDLLFP